MHLEEKNIILFDGVCNLCNFSINFIIKHDPKVHFYFVSIQSSLGKKLLKKYQLEEIDSLILLQNKRAYIYSDAVLHIAKGLQSWYGFLYYFNFIPKRLRDWTYRRIAKSRYQIFGKREVCLMPTEALRKRFLEEEKL